MSEPPPLDRSSLIFGRDLRHAGLVLLDRLGAMSINDLIETLHSAGYHVAGENPRKVVSDAMRVEVKRGRARRVGWGRYAIARLARTTRWRLANRWNAATGAALDDEAAAARQVERANDPGRLAARAARRPLIITGVPEVDRLQSSRNRTRWVNGQALRRYLLGVSRQRRGPLELRTVAAGQWSWRVAAHEA